MDVKQIWWLIKLIALIARALLQSKPPNGNLPEPPDDPPKE